MLGAKGSNFGNFIKSGDLFILRRGELQFCAFLKTLNLNRIFRSVAI